MEEKVEQVTKKPSFKERHYNKLKQSYFNPVDMKYRGPLSYRYLRIMAWICILVAQVMVFCSFAEKIVGFTIINSGLNTFFTSLASLSTPFFIIAAFGVILCDSRNSYKKFIVMYGGAFLGLGIALDLLYFRYVDSLFQIIGLKDQAFSETITYFIKDKAQVNVFSDLLLFTLFNFFLNYNPTKYFQSKKGHLVFRLFSILPLVYVVTAYILKLSFSLGIMDMPFYIFPFLTTKSPLVFAIFVVASILIKHREKVYLKLGGTKKQYEEFLKTNRNSFYFSRNLVYLILIAIAVEIVIFFSVAISIYASGVADAEEATYMTIGYGLGQTFSLIFAIPFILLYSYTRTHENKMIDIIIPVAGIGIIVLAYMEGMFQLISYLVSSI